MASVTGQPDATDLRTTLDRRTESLVGERIERVRYFECGDEAGNPLWSEYPDLDSLDFGLELDLVGGRTVGLIWDQQFEQYDLNLVESELRPSQITAEANIVVSEVGSSSRWMSLLGVPIIGASFRWESVWGDTCESPQDLILDFADGHRVWIMAAELRNEDWLGGGMDHVTVVFDTAVAAKLGRER